MGMSAKGPTSAGPSALDRRGPYTIPVSNVRGGPIDQGGPFTGGSGLAFRFISQPTSQIVEDGTADVEFTVVVAGNTGAVTYQWQEDSGSGFGNMMGETAATLTIAVAELADDGNLYRCEVTDDNETITSNSAELIVYAALAISVQPSPQTVDVDDTATFSVTATGGYGALTYQWQVDTGAGFGNITGATSSSYETGVLTAMDDGNEYRCIVTDSLDNEVTSNAALLTVDATPDFPDPTNLVILYDRTAASPVSLFAAISLTTCNYTGSGNVTINYSAGGAFLFATESVEISGCTSDFAVLNGTIATVTTGFKTFTVAPPLGMPVTAGTVAISGTPIMQPVKRWVSQVNDQSGNGYHATVASRATSMRWNGTEFESFGTQTTDPLIAPGTSGGDAFRAAVNSKAGVIGVVFTKNVGAMTYMLGNANYANRYSLGANSTTQYALGIGASGLTASPADVNSAIRYAMIFRWNGSNLREIYRNGVDSPIASDSSGDTPNLGSSDAVNWLRGWFGRFGGTVAGFVIYADTALTDSGELQDLYDAMIARWPTT